MPAPNTAVELVEVIRKSKLIEPARLDAYLAVHPGPYDTPGALGTRLQADGLLTAFQCEQLLRGKHRRFFLGRYKVLDRIGLGGMGEVMLAEHTGMRRRVAVKVLPTDRAANPYSRERFFREARAAGQLDHPNLVRAFDVDQEGETIFLVMELVDGVTLHDLVRRSGPLAPTRAAYYLWQAAQGLAYLAHRGLIHRDIKPANLLVDRAGVVKILDLGLVRSETETDELTRGEGVKILGTADYLAPEQAINCSHVDIRADIYGLGATAYYLLTGNPPFQEDTVARKLLAHQMTPVKPAHEVRTEVPVLLSAVVTKMLAKKPEDRFQSPDELLMALEPWAQTPPPPPTDQEIPAVGGLSGAVAVGTSASRGSRSGGSSISMGGSAASAIAAQSGRINPSSTATPTPAAVTPAAIVPPSPPPPPPATPPVVGGTTVMNPLGLPTLNARGESLTPKRTPKLEPKAEPAATPRRRLRQRVSIAVGFGIALIVAAWNVAVLTGAVAPLRGNPAPTAKEAAGKK